MAQRTDCTSPQAAHGIGGGTLAAAPTRPGSALGAPVPTHPHPAPTARPRDPSTAHGDPGRPHPHATPLAGTDGALERREGPCAGGTRVCEVCGGADPAEGCQGCGGVGEVSL